MSNMSYCRFQNTLHDLRDCQEALEDGALNPIDPDDALSPEELRAARSLIRICGVLANDFAEYSEER